MKKIFCLIALCFATNAFSVSCKPMLGKLTAGCTPPLSFFRRPTFPKTLSACQTFTLRYIIQNNTNETLPLSFSSSISEGTLTDSGGTCGSTLAPNATCTKNYLFTPPDNPTSSRKNITGSVQVAYNGRYPLTDNRIQFFITPDGSTPLEFLSHSTFPIGVPSGGSISFSYELVNHARSAIPITFVPTVPSGTITQQTGGCGTSIAACGVCTQHFTYTAPVVASTTTVTGSMSVTYVFNGAHTLNGANPVFTVTAASPTPSITILNPNLMLINRDFGNSQIRGSLTLQNNGTNIINSIFVSTTHAFGINYDTSASTCAGSISLAPGGTCTVVFTGSGSLGVGQEDFLEFTPKSGSNDGQTQSAFVSALSVTPLAPPTDSSVGMTLVNGCSDSTNDGGLVLITNNSQFPLSDITISNPGSALALTVTNPPFEENNNVYCNGNTLNHNQFCEVRLRSSAAPGTTGNIVVSGIVHLDNVKVSAHHVTIPAKVVAPAGSFPYTIKTQAEGGFIFVADNSCNLVEVVSNTDQSTPSWSDAATYCSSNISGYSDWRLMDLGPVFGPVYTDPVSGIPFTLLSGEPCVLDNDNTCSTPGYGYIPYANIQPQSDGVYPHYWGNPADNSADNSDARDILFGGFTRNANTEIFPANQKLQTKTSGPILQYTRCVRAFTTG